MTAAEDFFSYTDYGDAELDDGNGNDTITFDPGDTIIGGEGADRFIRYLTPGNAAVIADFNLTEDRLTFGAGKDGQISNWLPTMATRCSGSVTRR